MTQRQELSKRCWKNGTSRLAGCRVATNLQFAKKKRERNAIKSNKTRYAYILDSS